MKDDTQLSRTKYLESVADQLGSTGPKPKKTPGVPTHRATMDTTPVPTDDETKMYSSCVGALMFYVWDPVDAQLSILGSYLRAPTTGAVEALRRVTRYLLGTKNAHIKISFW